MKISERTLRISAASFIALIFISAGYLLSGPSFLTTKSANAESTEELLQQYSTKDTDGDTLPDWQEALYGTDPAKADTDGDGVSDGEAARTGKLTPNALAAQLPGEATSTPSAAEILSEIPGVDPAAGSITEQFSHDFFQRVVESSNGTALTDDQKQQIATELFGEYAAKAGALFTSKYTIVSVHTNASMSTSQYAENLETILKKNEVPEGYGDPVELMDDLVNKGDERARAKVETLSAGYGAMRDDLLAAQVPPALTDEHLNLIRSFDSLEKATAAVSTYEKDPLGMLGGISLFQPSSKAIVDALQGISVAILAGGEPAAGQPGSYILAAVRSTQAQ